MKEFFTVLAWVVMIPSFIIFIIKVISGIRDGKQYPATGQTFIIVAICLAWLISQC